MTYHIRSLGDGILEVIHTDELTMEEASESRQRSGRMMAAQGLVRVLVDVSAAVIKELPDTMALFDFNVSYYHAFPLGSSIACVVSPDKRVVDEAEFAETIALNRGITMRIFTDRDAAIAWLKDQHNS